AVPRERSGYSMGLIQVGMWSGVALGPFVGGIIADVVGYEATYYVTAAMLALTWLVVWLAVDEHFVPPSVEVQKKNGSLFHQWHELMAIPGVVATYTLLSLNWMVRTMLTPYTPLLIAALLHKENNIATVTGIIAGGAALSTTLSSLYLGRKGDQIGHRKIVLAGVAAAVLFSLPQYMVVDVWQLGLLQVMVGVAVGGMMPSLNALLNSYTPSGTEGAVYGLDTSITSATRTIAPMLGSAAVAIFGLRGVFLMSGFVFLLALIIALRHLPPTEQEKPQPSKIQGAQARATAGD
ncbi:MAG: MFS transporter, partial [Anaerolineae bacterium]|nr:MFS transporter [Anaerolineae bacterium]